MRGSYAKGRSHEYYIRDKLRREGWWCERLAGSKPLDLIALKVVDGELKIRLIECKAGSSKVTKRDREKFKEVKEKLGITVEVL